MKRFTETNKWRDPWFRKLSPTSKLLFQWLVDNCDNAGVIDIDLEAASFDIGQAINENHIAEIESRFKRLPNGKLWVFKFIGFQYGTLSASGKCVPHLRVIESLKSHGISYPNSESRVESRVDTTLKTRQDKTRQEKEPERKEGVQGEIDAFPEVLNVPEFKSAWNRWHEHLKQKRKPATIHARDLQLAKLSKMGVQKAIITLNHCIEHNWQGIYEPNTTGTGVQNNKPNPRNFGIAVGPTNYANSKPRLQREREAAEKERMAKQMAERENRSPEAGSSPG